MDEWPNSLISVYPLLNHMTILCYFMDPVCRVLIKWSKKGYISGLNKVEFSL